MAQTTSITDEEIRELLVVLNVALYEFDTAIEQSHDHEEMEAYKEQQKIIKKWIHRFSHVGLEEK